MPSVRPPTSFSEGSSPHVEAIRHQEHEVCVRILKKSAELGLTAVVIPEKFGGMEMDLTSMMLVRRGVLARGFILGLATARTPESARCRCCFGTEEQKQRYLPKLAKAEMIAAYCLSEPQAGSDALAARTRADLTPTASITCSTARNSGSPTAATRISTPFSRRSAARSSRRSWSSAPGPASRPAKEEKKMGIKGSSTTAVFFDNVKVPVENVLGEIGRRPHHRVQHSEPRPLEARPLRAGRLP